MIDVMSSSTSRLWSRVTSATADEIGGPNRTMVRRLLRGARRLRLLIGDPSIGYMLDGQTVALPLSHELPVHRAAHPNYSKNLSAVVAASTVGVDAPCVVDVGANVGDSVAIIRAVTNPGILCIEGDPTFLPYLRRNTAGLADVEIADTYVRSGDTGDRAGVVREGGTAHLVAGAGVAVPFRTLEEILDAHPRFRVPHVLKIDTDGHDAAILRASEEVIRRARPVLFFEFDVGLALKVGAADPSDVFEWLADLGYRWFVSYANSGGLRGSAEASELRDSRVRERLFAPGPDTPYVDVCAIPNERPDVARALS